MSNSQKEEDDSTSTLPSADEVAAFIEKLDSRAEHIDNVQRAARKLAHRLAKQGEFTLAMRLVQNAYRHDNSKFDGIEWKYLELTEPNKELKALAIFEHHQRNDHHPEHFANGIKDMSELQIAEMVCDWWARSSEGGGDLRKWATEEASKRFGFSLKSITWKRIKRFIDLLLDPELKQIKPTES